MAITGVEEVMLRTRIAELEQGLMLFILASRVDSPDDFQDALDEAQRLTGASEDDGSEK